MKTTAEIVIQFPVFGLCRIIVDTTECNIAIIATCKVILLIVAFATIEFDRHGDYSRQNKEIDSCDKNM